MGPWTLYDLWSEFCQIVVVTMLLRWIIEKLAPTYGDAKSLNKYISDGRQ